MAKLKSYSCTKCAGILNFDEDQELFGCPFCGNEFNLVDIHRDEMIAQAEAALKRLRFDTAKEKYEAVLAKNPHDFEALLGIVLAEGKLSSTNALGLIDKVRDCEIKPAKGALRKAKAEAFEGTEYLEKLTELFDLAEQYKKLRDDKSAQTQQARDKFQEIADMEADVEEYKEAQGEVINHVLSEAGPMFFCGFMFLVCAMMAGTGASYAIMLILLGVGLAFVAFFVIRFFYFENKKKKNAAPLERTIANSHVRAEIMSSEVKEIREMYLQKYAQLKELDPTVNGYTPPAASRVEAGQDPFADVTKTVNCAKCGGQLLLDKEKRLYECKFCGVAYGTSLFFNDPFGKAKKALRAADYTEADQRFSHMLMVEPGNFNALLGRVLCAGRWQGVYDIDLEDKMLPFMEEHLTDRADEAVMHSNEENKAFFFDIQSIVTCFIKWTHHEQLLKSSQNAIKYAGEKAGLSFSDQPDAKRKLEKAELEKKVADCKSEMKELRGEFNKLKESLLLADTEFAPDENKKR